MTIGLEEVIMFVLLLTKVAGEDVDDEAGEDATAPAICRVDVDVDGDTDVDGASMAVKFRPEIVEPVNWPPVPDTSLNWLNCEGEIRTRGFPLALLAAGEFNICSLGLLTVIIFCPGASFCITGVAKFCPAIIALVSWPVTSFTIVLTLAEVNGRPVVDAVCITCRICC